MKRGITIYGKIFTKRHIVLGILLVLVILTQSIHSLGFAYSQYIYPHIARPLSGISNLFPFAIGDLFIGLSIAGILFYPIYARRFKKKKWKTIGLNILEYLLWIYVWFYIAWGLNYSQPNFYQRSGIPHTAYTKENFRRFTDNYIRQLNASYVDISSINPDLICREAVEGYHRISDSLSIHAPFHQYPRVKRMLYTPLISMVGVTGSMGPFFCEFTLNGDLLPPEYPATYAHEMAHLLGISSEAEANFYAYQVCIHSKVGGIRFSGYLSILRHVLINASRLMNEDEYSELFNRIRPEIIDLAQNERKYWTEKYSPFIGNIQDWLYELYLKGNKIKSGQKNYSEVVGLLISYEEWKYSLSKKNKS
ncbi:DUF3810 domain-containing protein [Bacteroidaceae bacterium HV4-6-C5C]|nr:DUF3810 domain-containing protein [Bacteroidaceae bacterium HV4-6-C5C]